MALIPWLACTAPGPTHLRAERVPGGVLVVADAPIGEVTVSGPHGVAVGAGAPSSQRFVALDPRRPSTLTIEAAGASTTLDVPGVPADLLLELPTGAPPVWLAPGDVVRRGGPGDTATLRIVSAGRGTVRVDGADVALGVPGELRTLTLPIRVDALRVEGGGDTFTVSWSLSPALPSTLVDVVLPVGADGSPEPGRAPGVVWAPPLGRDAPWGYAGVRVANPAEGPATVRASLRVADPAFAPRLPGSPSEVSAVATVPGGGEVTLTLPLFVAPGAAPGPVPAKVVLSDVATGLVLDEVDPHWRVEGGDLARAGFLATLPLSLAGLLALTRGGPRFLRTTPVHELTLVSALAAVTFVVGAAFQLLGYGVAALLGPFAPFLTALFDDLFRVALLAALVTRVPRVGVVSAAAVVGFLLRGIALGGLHPADLLHLGNQVALLEVNLWIVGLTRSASWRGEGVARRTARLAAGFAPAQAASVAIGLLTTSAVYRLHWDPTWAAAMVALPGFLYVVVAAGLSAPLSRELERVAE